MIVLVFWWTLVPIEEGVILYPLNCSWICVLFQKVYCGIEELLTIHISAKVGDDFLSFLRCEEFYEGDGIVKV